MAQNELSPAAGPYSHYTEAAGLVFISGQLGADKDGSLPDSVEEQAALAFSNLKKAAEAAGSSIEKIVKTTVFIRNMADFAKVNEIYKGVFRSPYPARSCVEVSALPKGALVEIEAIAVK